MNISSHHAVYRFGLNLLLLLGLVLPGCSGDRRDAGEFIVHGGTILTMDPARPSVDAFLVREGRIAALGPAEQLFADHPQARSCDLGGRVVLPGFIDSHTHVHELGHDRRKVDLTGTMTVAGMVARFRNAIPEPEPGGWLIGSGWDEGEWATIGYPDRAALDAAFPENPVWCESLHGFAGFANGRALAAAGIDRETPDPEPGRILRRADGEATGTLLTRAQALVTDHIPPPTLEETKEILLLGLNLMAREGVTSVHEAGLNRQQTLAFSELRAEGRLPIRVYGMIRVTETDLLEEWFARGPLIDPEAVFTVRAIKIFYDGSLGSRTALMREPYSDDPAAAAPTIEHSPEEFRGFLERAAETGFQVVVHCIGDEANDRYLAETERIAAARPGLDHRWRNEHAQIVLPDYYTRAAEVGLISSMQTSHAVLDMGWAGARVGPERIRHGYAWRSMLEAGVPLIVNSDLPAVPWKPVETLYFGVTRQNLAGEPAGGWFPRQRLTVDETLRAMTVRSAWAAFQEDQLGSLEAGKFADFVELDRNPYRVAPAELKDLRVVATWVGGRKLAF